MEVHSPTRLVTTSNSITEGRKLATCRSFADTSELHIVKKSPDKQDMHAYMVGRFLGRWLTENQAILTLVQVQLHLQSNWCCVPLSSHSGRKPTHQAITSADVLAGRMWRRVLNSFNIDTPTYNSWLYQLFCVWCKACFVGCKELLWTPNLAQCFHVEVCHSS